MTERNAQPARAVEAHGRHRHDRADESISQRASAAVRERLGERLRSLRRDRRLSQDRLGELAGLSGKFIGEVERGEKSISIDSLYRVAEALVVPLSNLTDLGEPQRHRTVTAAITDLVTKQTDEDLRDAYRVLRALFGGRRRS